MSLKFQYKYLLLRGILPLAHLSQIHATHKFYLPQSLRSYPIRKLSYCPLYHENPFPMKAEILLALLLGYKYPPIGTVGKWDAKLLSPSRGPQGTLGQLHLTLGRSGLLCAVLPWFVKGRRPS